MENLENLPGVTPLSLCHICRRFKNGRTFITNQQGEVVCIDCFYQEVNVEA